MKKVNQLLFISIFSLLIIGINACKDDTGFVTPTCNTVCQNDGILTIDCTCACPDGYEGQFCQIEVCDIECQNNGYVDNSDCSCNCLTGYVGEFCETCVGAGTVANRNDFWVSPGAVNYVNDMEVTLPDGYVMTGVGFGLNVLMVEGREFNQDGTLGPAYEFRDGDNPSGALLFSYSVPDGHVVTGLGYGISSNQVAYRVVVNHNEILLDDNCDFYLGPELLYDNNVSTASLWRWLKVSDSNYDTRYHFFGGLGIKNSLSYGKIETEIRQLVNYL